MKLRTRLALGLASVSLVAAGGLFSTATVVIRRTYAQGRAQQAAAAREAVEDAFRRHDRALGESLRAVDEALGARSVETAEDPRAGLLDTALGGDGDALRALQQAVEDEARVRDLDVLDVVRADGVVIASAHDPLSRLSRVDRAAAAREGMQGLVLVQVAAVADEPATLTRPAYLSTARSASATASTTSGAILSAGWFLDAPARLRAFAGPAEIARLDVPGDDSVVLGRDPFDAGSAVTRLSPDDPDVEVWLERQMPMLPGFTRFALDGASPRTPFTRFALDGASPRTPSDANAPAGGVASFRVGGADAGREAQRRLFRAFLGISGLLLLACFPLASLLARRLAAPIDALADGARALALGNLDHRVPAPGRGVGDELGELVEAFNGMARDLKDSRARLLQSERVAAWREIARRIAHEIKNPLTPIQLAVETTRRAHREKRADFDEIFEESAVAILEEVDSLKKLVKEFSEFARMPEPVLALDDLNETVRGAVRLFAGLPDGVTLTSDFAAGLPMVVHDREQIARAVVNLVGNAVDAVGARGTVVVRTETVRTEHGEGVGIRVTDNGPGIPSDDRAKVFTPYFTTKSTGTGLGLAIVQRIVTDHGGEITVGDGPGGKGAAFTISLRKPS